VKNRLPYYTLVPVGTYWRVIRIDREDKAQEIALYKDLITASSIAHSHNMDADEEF
jgi:hypothetical protein